MAKLKHIESPYYWYFITTTLCKPLRLFEKTSNTEIVINTLHTRLQNGGFRLDEFVIMPDHIHLILIPMEKSLSRIMGEIKRGTARLINKAENITKRSIWLSEYYEKQIAYDKDLYSMRTYIWYNPVKAGIVFELQEYRFSSANPKVRARFGLDC